jgi:transposase
VYQLKVEILGELEELAEERLIDLYYGDEARVSTEPCIPYGWQFADEDVFMPSAKSGGVNCFALLSRSNECRFETTQKYINAEFIFEQLERLSFGLPRLSVVVLDNARVHTAGIIKEQLQVWQERGLFIFYLPRYSPHLNIAEVLWRKLKYEWLAPLDYVCKENLFYTVRQALAAVGTNLRINFSKFRLV